MFSKSYNPDEGASFHSESFEIKSLEQKPIDFNDFKGKKMLLVNVASKCGFTPQYKELQELHEENKGNLVIVGFPCNQFGSQEAGSAGEIATFCERNYGVEFLITEKIDVKGDNQHPIFSWLTKKDENGLKNGGVKWNFQKYLLDEDGKLIDYFLSTTTPKSSKIMKWIE